MLLYHFGVMLALFFSAYYYLLRGNGPFLWPYSVDHYLGKPATPFVRICNIYYDSKEGGSTRAVSEAVADLLEEDGVVTGVFGFGGYKYAEAVETSGNIVESLDEMLDITREFSVVIRYVREPAFKGDLEVAVSGGRSMVINVTKVGLKSDNVPDKIYDLISGVFFKYVGMPSTCLTPILDISFVLMSDKQKVKWNVKNDIIAPFFHKIANAMSLFYDINLHSRVISGANLTHTMKLKPTSYGDHSIVDLQEQEATMFDLLERVSSVEIGTKDSSIYRHSLAFMCHVPEKELRFYDRALERETDSFMIKGLGILSLMGPSDDHDAEHHLSSGDIASLMSSWVTHIRKMHNLPATLTDTIMEVLKAEDEVTVLEDGHYLVKSPNVEFTIRLTTPGLVAFYGFELSKIAESLYGLYLKGSLDNMHKVLKPLSSLSFMSRVSERAVGNIRISYNAISCLYGKGCGGRFHSNMKLLSLARTAFKQSLEAMGDDETYARNVVSVEHGLALFMCDVFPFLLPLVSNGVRHFLNK